MSENKTLAKVAIFNFTTLHKTMKDNFRHKCNNIGYRIFGIIQAY